MLQFLFETAGALLPVLIVLFIISICSMFYIWYKDVKFKRKNDVLFALIMITQISFAGILLYAGH